MHYYQIYSFVIFIIHSQYLLMHMYHFLCWNVQMNKKKVVFGQFCLQGKLKEVLFIIPENALRAMNGQL